MKKISQWFLQGLLAILPITITVYLLFWLGDIAESTLGAIIRWVLPDSWYWPGMGIAAGILFVLAVGVLMNAYLFRQLAQAIDALMMRIPLIKSIYNSIRDIASFASGSKDSKLQKVVLVQLHDDVQLLGFITREEVPFFESEKRVAVYVPMSYQVGGFTYFLPESKLTPVDMKVKDAMHFALTAGVTGGR